MEQFPCERGCEKCLTKLCTRCIPIFGSLKREQLEKIATLMTRREYHKDEVILLDGARSDYVAIIVEGGVKATKYTSDGREQILYVFSKGDFFGEQNLLFKKPAFYNVIALEPAELYTLQQNDFQALLKLYPDIGIAVIRELGWRLEHLESAVHNIGVRSVESRISIVLLELASNIALRKRRFVGSPATQPQRFGQLQLSSLEAQGVIRSINKRTMLIRDLGLLEAAK